MHRGNSVNDLASILVIVGAMVFGASLCVFVTWRRQRNYGPMIEPDLSSPEPEEWGQPGYAPLEDE